MTTVTLFQWVVLERDVPDSLVKAGDRGVVVDCLPTNEIQQEPGYMLEVFKDGETSDVVAVPVSWVTPLPEVWGKSSDATFRDSSHKAS